MGKITNFPPITKIFQEKTLVRDKMMPPCYNVEGSAFGLRRAKGSVKANEWFSEIKGTIQFNQTKSSVKSKASDEIRGKREGRKKRKVVGGVLTTFLKRNKNECFLCRIF